MTSPKKTHILITNTALVKNYLKIAFRSLSRNRLATLINIIGLISGFFASLIIALYADYQLSYDSFHQDYESTFRVSYKRIEDGQTTFNGATTFLPVGPVLLNDYAEVYNQSRLYYPFTHGVITYGENSYSEEMPVFAEETYFEVFSFRLLEGNSSTALLEPKL